MFPIGTLYLKHLFIELSALENAHLRAFAKSQATHCLQLRPQILNLQGCDNFPTGDELL